MLINVKMLEFVGIRFFVQSRKFLFRSNQIPRGNKGVLKHGLMHIIYGLVYKIFVGGKYMIGMLFGAVLALIIAVILLIIIFKVSIWIAMTVGDVVANEGNKQWEQKNKGGRNI